MSTKEHRDQRRPRTAGGLLARPNLEARLDEAFGRRLTTVVAGAGYGKTTLLAQWARDVECAWYTAGAADVRLSSLAGGLSDALGVGIGAFSSGADLTTPDEAKRADAIAAHLAADLERTLTHDVILVLDDAHELDASPSARLVESLVRQAPVNLHVVLSSRAEPPFRIQRLRGQGKVLELDASQLGFDAREVEDLLELELGPGARRFAPRLHEVTEGWPVAVRLAIAALERVGVNEREEAIDRLRNPEGRSSRTWRLSVAMSMLRSVLDPDKRFGSDQFVAADARAVWLKTTNLAIDVDDFLSVAQAGLTETDADAIASLKSAEAIYAGDFLEKDAYEEWSVSLRERARTAYVEVARKLAGAAEAERDFDAAARYLLRVLELDRHDERAHLDLITTLSQGGRLGDARQAYRIYADRMKEIDVEAVPYPV